MDNITLRDYCKNNSDLEIQDLFKFLYQSCFGCEHLVSDYSTALRRINDEMKLASLDDLPGVEELYGDFCRVHLKYLDNSFTPEKLCELFIASSEMQTDGREKLENSLKALISDCENGLIPFDFNDVKKATEKWREEGFTPVHHSDNFRNAHHPAYRVIKNDFLLNFQKSV